MADSLSHSVVDLQHCVATRHLVPDVGVVVVDRVIIRPDLERRLADALETILTLGEGLAISENMETKEEAL